MSCLVRFYEAYINLLTAVQNLSFGEMPDEDQLVKLFSALPLLQKKAELFKRENGDFLPLFMPRLLAIPSDQEGISKLDLDAYKEAWGIAVRAAGKEIL